MNSKSIRKLFIDFFASKNHHIVSSAPMVVKNDPTLMFTNAGMNQFKDYFLGNQQPQHLRIANTQKCLRVSGKHNDLEEVGHDTYHHTMFEMLGNWSFGDYFKKEAIDWGWEFLTEVCKIDKNRLYVTVFGGDSSENLDTDNEAFDIWKKIVPEDRIIYGSKKDNFWEMGDAGPCGPCSEIHVDIRDDAERQKINGKDLVNHDHPLVIEIWNLVFIEFNRKADGTLEKLKAKHVDTGMGFERLCMVLQGVKSNYETDVFTPILEKISEISNVPYGKDEKQDIAMRVIADHLRAVSFAIADGQIPSNIKAGYVIRRILRRAIRYAYVFLNMKEPFIFQFVDVLTHEMGDAFPELKSQQKFIKTIIQQEEISFLKTLTLGLQKFENYIQQQSVQENKIINGEFAFELYDTYGFPVDLTSLMAKEIDWKIDISVLEKCMAIQKERSKKASNTEVSDWIELDTVIDTLFVGYDTLSEKIRITKFRKVTSNTDEVYHLVFDKTPFYAESGGQIGDIGTISNDNETIEILHTLKENNLIIHKTAKLPQYINDVFTAEVHLEKRTNIAIHHSATHLLHAALREVLGNHVEQKGSLVEYNRLRFDFSHFSKLSDDDLQKIETTVNSKIRANIPLSEKRNIPYNEAMEMGAMALFGEKYAENVRIIAFDDNYSVELCGGTHVPRTGHIGVFKIISESAIAAGIRRIEAVAGTYAFEYLNSFISFKNELSEILKKPVDVFKTIQGIIEENQHLKTEVEQFKKEKVKQIKKQLLAKPQYIGNIKFISALLDLDAQSIKDLAFNIKAENENIVLLLGQINDKKISISLMLSDDVVENKNLNAGVLIREIAKEINGGGGGQAFFATAGGSNINGFDSTSKKLIEIIEKA